ncbi:hypothetical protein N657DRAFT_710058 [Parathielavia appendiculata]|uniref:Uncharacterized protein n=1 Tax=Parathielavia appendiculata TaxID=2587402 RepID=A0AAN6U4N3_9PEZI|nr:hypothetical protein N657DRAFT_710058 [Parathielavia appendiculata]
MEFLGHSPRSPSAACCAAESVSDNETWELIQASKNNETALHTIYAPPGVSAAEFRDQFVQARRLKTKFREPQEKSDYVDKNITLTCIIRESWVSASLMGGAKNVAEEMAKLAYFEIEYLDNDASLNPDTVIELAKRDFWIYTKPERIAAKSKANVL